ncbi:hypothetical protein [Pelomonas aquatica]|jgi:hypothetical protein|uniref:Uncharacterized protein n=1 Tax=Pelomonas aquatica TaxID=431058 RepID=A0A9X4R4T6_9BURK|nr:hypothetical protein [Pelomonas aquatica]MCY4755134.1 hypothetical protein [Pelomonas aquatica]MDG0863592.1 hypothetical protein [Pelomonas aquatica]
MPKVTKDDLLLEKVKALVAQEKSYEAAAARLNVNTTTLWRFAKNGTAIARTRVSMERGLANLDSESEMQLRGAARRHEQLTPQMFSSADLREMRALCDRMVAWIDQAESALAKSTSD